MRFSTKDSSSDSTNAQSTIDCVKVMESMDDWNKIIESKTPVIMQCSTSWCRPCQILRPVMEKLVKNHDGKVIFYYIDVEKFQPVGEMLQVSLLTL